MALVVEDEFLVSLGVTALLEDLGYEVLGPIARLQDAYRAAEREKLDLGVLDINLAGELSWPVARVLQSRGVPFLFLTGYLEANANRPVDLAGAPMCPKPFAESLLRAEIDSLTRRRDRD